MLGVLIRRPNVFSLKKKKRIFRSADLYLNEFSVKLLNKQKSLVVELQGCNWVVMNYAVQLHVLRRKKYLHVLRILISCSAYAGYDLCVA